MCDEQQKKEHIRRRLLAARRAMSAQERQEASAIIQQHLRQSPFWQQARMVALYMALPEEANMGELLQECWDTSRQVLLPRVRRGEAGEMDFVSCSGPQDLHEGSFSLQEPLPELPIFQPKEHGGGPDLMLVPGVGFDRRGGRLGFGGGYYDRFLPLCPSSMIRIGICFHVQLVDALPVSKWDQRVHAVCTERELLCL